jgi:hypothetical protein
MHHFDDEVTTLGAIRRTQVPGGRLFIHEGVRPEPGSEGERLLIAEMEEYGTLESPFDPDYLVAVIREAGFTEVTRFAAVDDLLDLAAGDAELQRIAARLSNPPMNTVIAVNPAQGAGEAFGARIEARDSWRVDGDELELPITIANTGRGYWPASADTTIQHGVVTVGPFVPLGDGARIELQRLLLPRSMSSGEAASLTVRVPRAAVGGHAEVGVDLVREGIAWFAEYGSMPLVVGLPEEN